MSLKQSQARDPREVRGRSPRRFVLPLALLPALAALTFAAEPGDDGTARRAAGDGRGLTTFGDRFSQTFARRGFTSFSDIPLAPMGGFVPGGVSVPLDSGVSHHTSQRSTNSFGGSGFTVPESDFSQATLRVDVGGGFDDAGDDALLMPRVELPAIVFDHRPAAALIDATLDAAVRAATESGDLDLARSLDPDRR